MLQYYFCYELVRIIDHSLLMLRQSRAYYLVLLLALIALSIGLAAFFNKHYGVKSSGIKKVNTSSSIRFEKSYITGCIV